MAMLKKFGRLFTIKTRFEAWAVTYVIALGAIERGQHYLETYPGFGGWLLALACTGVVFLAGAKLLDSVKPQPAAIRAGPYIGLVQRRRLVSRNQPTPRSLHRASESRSSRRTD